LVLFQAGAINLGDVVSYVGLVSLFSFPVFISLFSYSQVSSGVSSARRILELIRTETDLDRNVAGYDGKMAGNIRFENVTFSYSTTLNGAGDGAVSRSGMDTLASQE